MSQARPNTNEFEAYRDDPYLNAQGAQGRPESTEMRDYWDNGGLPVEY